MELEQIRELIAPEQQAVDRLIQTSLHSDVALIENIGHYITNSGGKRLRPLVTLLSACACQYEGSQHIALAAIIEFIHTATLLHDDVVDASLLRRGRETANAVWGDHSSVLVGDFLYSRAFQMMVTIGMMDIMQVMADATNIISEGEVLQLLNAHDPDTTEQRYFDVINCKTAKLFEAACVIGAIVADQSSDIKTALMSYGLNLGIAYQLIDDVMDYSSDAQTMGKNVGDDLAEGKPTLPLIYIMQHGTSEQAELVRSAIREGNLNNLAAIQTAISETKALEYVRNQAYEYADRAKAALSPVMASTYKEALLALTHFVVKRSI